MVLGQIIREVCPNPKVLRFNCWGKGKVRRKENYYNAHKEIKRNSKIQTFLHPVLVEKEGKGSMVEKEAEGTP